jgi:hypothetical protein
LVLLPFCLCQALQEYLKSGYFKKFYLTDEPVILFDSRSLFRMVLKMKEPGLILSHPADIGHGSGPLTATKFRDDTIIGTDPVTPFRHLDIGKMEQKNCNRQDKYFSRLFDGAECVILAGKVKILCLVNSSPAKG